MLVSSYFDAEGNYFEDKLEYENKREEDVQIANGVLVVECRIVMLNCSKKKKQESDHFCCCCWLQHARAAISQ